MTGLDRSSWTARRVGPLDVDMLQEQRELLEQLRAGMTADSDTAGATLDAIDGMVHLTGYLTDCYEYAVEEAARPPAERARVAIGRVFDALSALADVLYEDREPHEDTAELRWQLPDLHEVLAIVAGAEVLEVPGEPLVCFPELAPIG